MMERSQGKKKEKSYYHTARHHHHPHHGKKKKGSNDHNAMRGDGGGPQSLRHGMVTDIGAPESMWGYVAYPDRVLRDKHHQRSYGEVYVNFNKHEYKRQLQIASATPRTYVFKRI